MRADPLVPLTPASAGQNQESLTFSRIYEKLLLRTFASKFLKDLKNSFSGTKLKILCSAKKMKLKQSLRPSGSVTKRLEYETKYLWSLGLS